MSKLQKPVCPYCGRKVNLITAWKLRRQGEFQCPRCEGFSNIVLDSAVSVTAVIAIAVSALIFVIVRLIWSNFTFFSVILVFAPFLVFYILSPFFVRLRRVRPKKPNQRRRQMSSGSNLRTSDEAKENLDQTRVL